MTKILLIDDSKMIIGNIRPLLEAAGYAVVVAHDGLQGVKAYDDNLDVKVIFTDLNMPLVGGIKMCEILRAKYGKKLPPIIAITTEASKEIQDHAKTLGIVGWIIKPFDWATLPGITAKILARYYPKK